MFCLVHDRCVFVCVRDLAPSVDISFLIMEESLKKVKLLGLPLVKLTTTIRRRFIDTQPMGSVYIFFKPMRSVVVN